MVWNPLASHKKRHEWYLALNPRLSRIFYRSFSHRCSVDVRRHVRTFGKDMKKLDMSQWCQTSKYPCLSSSIFVWTCFMMFCDVIVIVSILLIYIVYIQLRQKTRGKIGNILGHLKIPMQMPWGFRILSALLEARWRNGEWPDFAQFSPREIVRKMIFMVFYMQHSFCWGGNLVLFL